MKETNTVKTIGSIRTIQKVATHNGAFHPDDTFSIAILKTLFPQVEIVRSRNPEIYNACELVVDVGEGAFDHHQKGGNGVRENGVPYAAFGLVWRAFGPRFVRQFAGQNVESIVEIVDQKLVQGVDALDNGYNPHEEMLKQLDFQVLSICEAISNFNPNWDEELDEDEAFEKAVAWVQQFLIQFVKSEVAQLKAKELVEEAVVNQENHVIEFDRYVPWGEHLFNAPNNETIEYVIFRDLNSGEWRIQTVPIEPDSFVARKSLPETWAGLRDNDLNEVVGISDGVFVHNGRFIGGAISKESILKMAELALRD